MWLIALAGVAQCTECWPENRKVTNSIPSQGTCLVAGQVPGGERVRGNPSMYLSHIDISLPLFLPPFLPPFASLKINKIFEKRNWFTRLWRLASLKSAGWALRLEIKERGDVAAWVRVPSAGRIVFCIGWVSLLFSSCLQLIRWDPSTLGRALCFSQSPPV